MVYLICSGLVALYNPHSFLRPDFRITGGIYPPSLCEPESVPPRSALSNFPAKKHVDRFGEKFSLKICPDDFFGLSRVAGCAEATAAFGADFRSVREVTETVKVCDFF
jgi:hypothetical protein